MEFMTQIERKDINEIVNSPYINWHCFFNSSILVTGATGLIGSAIVKSLLCANETLNSNIKIFALVRNKAKAEKMFGKSVEYVVQDIVEPLKIREKIDFVIHTANSTASKSFVEEPVETISSIVQGTDNVLRFAKDKKVRSAVYLSSMEVYGKTDFDCIEPLKENDYGYVDLAEVRSSYPQGKRLAENLCVAYAGEYEVPVKVARLVQTIGSGVPYDDNRVFVQFARNIVERKNIVLHTTGSTVRCYCYVTDAVSAIFVLLERGVNGELYNVANEKTTCSIKEMAEMLCKIYTSSKLIFNLESSMNNYYLPTLKTVLDSSKLQQLNWMPEIMLEQMFERLIQDFYLREKPIAHKRDNFFKKILRLFIRTRKYIGYKQVIVCGKKFIFKTSEKYKKLVANSEIRNNKVVFYGNHGAYSGNQRYIADELIKRGGYELVWIDNFNNCSDNNFPEQIRCVDLFSAESYKELAEAKVWICSQRFDKMWYNGLIKKTGQYYIQTWHGSLGIKKVGFDIYHGKEEPWMYIAKKDSEMIDYLISNSEFETNVYRGTFWGQGKPLLLGHARNDIFFREQQQLLRKKVCAALNIPENKKIILYAPTFRDSKDISCYNMDHERVVAAFKEKFGFDCILALRLHPWILSFSSELFDKNSSVINGNNYGDIQELMVAADFMITDYSSCIFDFMLSRKPGFIFATDIEKYNTERGFYYPLESTPFPIAADVDKLIKNIADFDMDKYKSAVEEFLEDKACIEDGHASERIAKLVEDICNV